MKTSATRQIFRLQTLFRTLAGPKVAARSINMPNNKLTVQEIEDTISKNKVVVYSKSYCPFCKKAKDALKGQGIDFMAIEIEHLDNMDEIQDYFLKTTKGRSVPRVFINGKFLGGGDETAAAARNGSLKKMVE